jgi:L-amino acid N-acyltransferase YncA
MSPREALALSMSPLAPHDWGAVRSIYLEGIATGDATFERSAPDWDQWDQGHLRQCRFVALAPIEVVGWAALSPVSRRAVYAGVAETSVYVAQRARGHGVGKALLTAVVAASEQHNIWMLQAGIFPENVRSLDLHRGAGFRIVGTRERLGCMDGRWRDVILMERRSVVAGR